VRPIAGRSSGCTKPMKSSSVNRSPGGKPNISRIRPPTQKQAFWTSNAHGAASAASVASFNRSSPSRNVSSYRMRAKALAKICATNFSRWTSASDHVRGATMSWKLSAPNGAAPPTASGQIKAFLSPKERQLSTSRPARSGTSSREDTSTHRPAKISRRAQGTGCAPSSCRVIGGSSVRR